MKKLFVSLCVLTLATVGAQAKLYTPTTQMEQLGRGVTVVAGQSGGRFISWRLLGTDPKNITFDVLRNGVVIGRGLTNTTCYADTRGTTTDVYKVVARVDGKETDSAEALYSWDDIYTSVQLDRPAGGTVEGSDYTYSPNDCSVGDVDGDGEYEIVVKWDPSNSKDNASSGYTGNCILDCYRLSGERLWRVDLGINIRAGSHYTQFLIYDFDGDGRSEMICKTAPGSVDGQGNYVTAAATDSKIKSADNTVDYRNTSGKVLSGPEYLTVFDGLTGAAVHTIWYNPNRAGGYGAVGDNPSSSSFWGDNSGNRCDRFLAAVAHLDKGARTASAVMVRGYYSRAYLWAVDFDGSQLKHRWLHCSSSGSAYSVTDANNKTTSYTGVKSVIGSGSGTMYGNGNHNLSVADVDGDGCDEIIWGSAACDNDGRVLYGVGFGHGDAIHMADLMPDRPGLEVFDVHESKSLTYSWDIHDARTGEVLLQGGPSGVDNGRGIAAQVDPDVRGCYFNSSAVPQTLSCITGDTVSQYGPTIQNFRIYWDGDLQEEYLGDISRHNSPFLEKWNGNGCSRMYPKRNTNLYNIGNSRTINGTKGVPCLQADIMGDWREEMVFVDGSDPSRINIFSTNVPTDFRVPTLMHDHVYRMGIAWQNVSYNQPPHLGYYLPDYIAGLDDDDDEPTEATVVFAQDYEDATDASSWVSGTYQGSAQGSLTLETDDDEYGNYVQFAPGTANSRACYTLFSSDDKKTYTVEFDASIKTGSRDGCELTVMTEGGVYNVGYSNYWYGYTNRNGNDHELFSMRSAGSGSADFTINHDDGDVVTIPSGKWCHYKMDVDSEKGTIDYSVVSKVTGGELTGGTRTLANGASARLQGIYWLSGRYNGVMKIDNIRVTTTETVSVGIADAVTSRAAGRVYNLQGQQLRQPAKGLNIIDGRKTVVK